MQKPVTSLRRSQSKKIPAGGSSSSSAAASSSSSAAARKIPAAASSSSSAAASSSSSAVARQYPVASESVSDMELEGIPPSPSYSPSRGSVGFKLSTLAATKTPPAKKSRVEASYDRDAEVDDTDPDYTPSKDAQGYMIHQSGSESDSSEHEFVADQTLG